MANKAITTEQFKIKLKEIHPNLKVINDYTTRRTHLLVQDDDGIIYSQLPMALLVGTKPSIESAINKTQAFIIKAVKIHGLKYNYSKTMYIKNSIKTTFICPEHGEFEQSPRNHLFGYGCTKCKKSALTRSNWIEKSNKNNKSSLYFIECIKNRESFIKIGITTLPIRRRFLKNAMPYHYKIIKVINSYPEIIYNEEIRLHRLFKAYKYKPFISFSGENECFTLDILPLIQNSTDLYPLSPY